ncbi:Bacterial alpha-L-rhamnosidase [Nonomuraea sp. PA05]|uniref:glycoside hydrolase family 78 protein n=1 Tax=Nonomuraea sp. PA05 TaxID=2604466 RepID=UPI0011D58AC6|nr:glycoside hydrolase family 78 protein [Nonomuraea sp. PA05]TYB71091.1 Bacterial alpha-L-rhamnosidase [Nonomuraea sp. PA05]
MLNVTAPAFEHHTDPLGVGESAPRLSWTVTTDTAGWAQAGYEIELGDGTATGLVESAESVLVPWPGAPLGSRERRGARVRVHGADGSVSDWSPWSHVETGLLDPADWRASAAAPSLELLGVPDGPALLLRRDFPLRGPLAKARLYVTAHGVFEAELNGRVVGDEVLAPGWTSYRNRLRYRTHDVTGLLREGANTLGATLADGWYRGRIGFLGGKTDIYGDRTALIAQLEITYEDGTRDLIATDEHWRCATGPVTSAGLYDGEKHDARLHPAGWSQPGFDDSAWLPAEALAHDPALLVAPTGPPVRRTGTVSPVEVLTGPSGETILDFGQNLVGRLRIRVQGPAGHTVTLRHAEVLENGALAIRPLRDAAALDQYTLRGDAEPEVYEPRFTTHGFRYAQLDGWPGAFDPADVVAVVCHTDMRPIGTFECSDPLLNRLHDNVVWSMRGNYVDLPTDCPQRDERLGWTGDIQVFAPAAAFLYDCAGPLSSWLADLAAEQAEVGTVPHYVPWVPLVFDVSPTAAWGDAAVLVPWVLYQRTGDLGLLGSQYASMTAWVDQVGALTRGHLWDRGFQFGDWLDPAAPPDDPGKARTDHALVATAYHAWTARVVAETAALLGHDADAARYAELAERVRGAFRREFVTPSGRLACDTQTAYALALTVDLLDGPEQRERAGRRLVELVAADDHRIGTGFVGTPLICDALCSVGAYDTAYKLLTQRACPSWLYPVTMGATTIWERWDSMLPDGSVNPGEMTSFNHYALGAVADWMHRTVAGLAPAEPGYRKLLVRPRPGGGLTHARATHLTPYGEAEVAWRLDGERLSVTVRVPHNTTAVVDLPGEPAVEAGPGQHVFHCVPTPQ